MAVYYLSTKRGVVNFFENSLKSAKRTNYEMQNPGASL
ncbi:hypothetical protein LLB_1705 [Legionella longbeachae D-4968]|nr:hypothetical protein LLB_1705 [Legionella longbeachae D-4968]